MYSNPSLHSTAATPAAVPHMAPAKVESKQQPMYCPESHAEHSNKDLTGYFVQFSPASSALTLERSNRLDFFHQNSTVIFEDF